MAVKGAGTALVPLSKSNELGAANEIEAIGKEYVRDLGTASHAARYIGLGECLYKTTVLAFRVSGITPSSGQGMRHAQSVLDRWRMEEKVNFAATDVTATNCVKAYALAVLSKELGVSLPSQWKSTKQLASHVIVTDNATLNSGLADKASIDRVIKLCASGANSTEIQNALAKPKKPRSDDAISKSFINACKKLMAEHADFDADRLHSLVELAQSEMERPSTEFEPIVHGNSQPEAVEASA